MDFILQGKPVTWLNRSLVSWNSNTIALARVFNMQEKIPSRFSSTQSSRQRISQVSPKLSRMLYQENLGF